MLKVECRVIHWCFLDQVTYKSRKFRISSAFGTFSGAHANLNALPFFVFVFVFLFVLFCFFKGGRGLMPADWIRK